MKMVVIGGTGQIGSRVVSMLGGHGHEAVAASPKTGVNTLTGEGLAEALAGASTVVDVSNAPSVEAAAVLEFFQTSTRNLLAAQEAAGVGHHVALSIVGTDRLPGSGYMRAKRAQEKLIEGGPIPYTIVRATQFFEFVASIADAATDGSTVRLAPVGFQPMAAQDVAEAVGRTAMDPPRNAVVEIAGPERFQMDDFFRTVLATQSNGRTVVTDPHATYFGAELGEASLVPGEGALLGQVRYGDWLARAASGR